MPPLAVILPAAGRSVRFGAGRDKLLEPLGRKAIVRHSIDAFLSRTDVGHISIATSDEERIKSAVLDHSADPDPRLCFCPGGASRAESVLAALQQVPDHIEWIAVHDAARPLVSQGLIDRTFAAAQQHGAAVPALPMTLTIKQASGPLPARVERTIPRDTLWGVQTPQIMRRTDLLAAYENCPLPVADITDDAQLLELAGRDVWLVQGDERNLKITTASDLRLAEIWLAEGLPARS
jgi:2-C-methyl-D-erythritol 4-phosphate cytidylyltransferase